MASPAPYYESRRIAEGGLTRRKEDPASKYPAPCTFTYKGVTASDWHTNKGIIWPTFKKLAPVVGIEPTCNNFFNMTDFQWRKIFDEIWKRAGGFEIDNQALANIVFQSYWGSGVGGALYTLGKWLKEYTGVKPKTFGAIAALLNKAKSEEEIKKLFDFLWRKRYDFYIGLNNPTYEKGWLKDWKKFAAFNQQWLAPGSLVTYVASLAPVIAGTEAPVNIPAEAGKKKNNVKKYVVVAGVTLLIGTGAYFGIRHYRKRKKLAA